MNLAVSNIAWAPVEDDAVIEILAARGVRGVEIAPSMVWPGWEGMSQSAAAKVAERYAQAGLEIPALQSIFYGRPDLQLFGSQETFDALLAHLGQVAAIARRFGAQTLVFGSPKNRAPGSLDPATAWQLAVDRFTHMGDICARKGVVLVIEANPQAYGCTFLTRWTQAVEMVRAVDHPGVQLHLDVACTVMAGDEPEQALEEATEIIRHIHISEPWLRDFTGPKINHDAFGKAIARSGYDGWLSIEMRRGDMPLNAIDQAITAALANYPSLGRQPV